MSKSEESLAHLRASFLEPSPQSRPTPLYWWSGTDLDIERMTWHLDLLCAKGVGGTIICYAHRPDGSVDHESPEPFSDPWWELLQQFVAASAERGLTVGICDYQVIGTILLRAATNTAGLNGGSLKNQIETVQGPGTFIRPSNQSNVLSRRAISSDGLQIIDAAAVNSEQVVWNVPDGDWILSTVTVESGQIYLFESLFDPLHPNSGKSVIDMFFRTFAEKLGPHLGTTFTTFFQDELELGLVTPMWNSLVGNSLEAAGFNFQEYIHLLWHGTHSEAIRFRGEFRDAVVNLLQENFFKPIFEWHEIHNTSLVMDQLSRGDLTLGHKHYSDFMETMAWYQGPGNDDPDLTGPRNIAAFRTSSSIAHINNRPYVTNEAFHSSGWGVTPDMILSGLNIDFAAGANQVVLHGLDYTLESGWWEWASPDFHFRQPWWDHSRPMWTYLSRISQILQSGTSAVEIALLDPTPELDFNSESQSPAMVSKLMEYLSLRGLGVDLVPQAYLSDDQIYIDIGGTSLNARFAKYKVVLIHGVTVLRENAYQAIRKFVQSGGVAIILGDTPKQTDQKILVPEDFYSWNRATEREELVKLVHSLFDADLLIKNDSVNLLQSHRTFGETEFFFVVNPGTEDISSEIMIRGKSELEGWDAWKGEFTRLNSVITRKTNSTEYRSFRLELKAGESALIVQTNGFPEIYNSSATLDFDSSDFSSDWKLKLVSNLDNRYFDYALDQKVLQVASYHINESKNPDGPWVSTLVDHGSRFQAFGPFSETENSDIESNISTENHFGVDLNWSGYRLSHSSGIPNDYYLLDRMTGPHGLKGVPSEFLDPKAYDLDAQSGDYYYFRGLVMSQAGSSVLRSSGRAQHKIWINGQCVREAAEIAASHFPPWNLRDMSAEIHETDILLKPGPNEVIIQIRVSANQPSRVAAVVGGESTPKPQKAQLLWWQGPKPAEKYFIDSQSTQGWFKVQVPPGAKTALVTTSAKLEYSDLNKISQTGSQYRITLRDNQKNLVFGLSRSAGVVGCLDSGAILGPIVWECESGNLELASWADLGLSDFSGLGIYEKKIAFESSVPKFAELELLGIEGTVRLLVNNSEVGIGYGDSVKFRFEPWLAVGPNSIVVESANTLVNLFSRLPSPFSIMQSPGGGFKQARLKLAN